MASSLVTAVFTLLFDVAVLVVGLLVWWALRGQGSFDDKPRPLESITEKAYILFLRTCRDMCLTLTAVSAAMLVPYFRLSDFQVELNLPITGNFSAARLPEHSSDICAQPSLHATGRVNHHDGGAGCSLLCEELDLPMRDIFQCAMMCIMTVVNGGVALAFLQRFQRQVQMFDYLDAEGTSPGPNGHRDRDDMDRIGRTLWFTELPTADRQTGRAWLLDEEGFQRVEADIARELETHLHGAPAPTPRFSPIEEIRVAPEVGRMLEVAPELRIAMERGDRYAELAEELAKEQESAVRREAPLTTQWRSCLSKRWYERRSSTYRDRSRALHEELQELVEAKKQMCGSAFVTFKNVSSARHFYSRKPDCCGRRRDLFFSFGHPPFASVTLRCMRAPHPSDLIWQNLQVPRRIQRCNLITRFILLLMVMMALVACLLLAVEHEWWSDLPFVQQSSQQIASLVLLVINSVLLPELIHRMASAVREHRHSRAEILQLHLNFVFLGINTLLIPLTGYSIIEIARVYFQHPFRNAWWQANNESLLGWAWLQIGEGCAFHTFRNTKWSFFLRYIMNSACFSNTMSGLALQQIVYRECAKTLALTQRDKEDATTPWPFPWGYWYAWCLNILATGLLLSMAVPLSLPCTALFFAVRHAVDQHNLCHNVYMSSFESEGTFVPRVLHYVRLIVATWWFFMGCVTLSGAKRAITTITNMSDEDAAARGGRGPLQVIPDIVTYFATMMVLLSLMMFIHSFWTLLESTHLLAWEGIKAVLEKEQAHIFDLMPVPQDNGRSIHRADMSEPGPLGRLGRAVGWLLCDADIFRQSSELVPTDENGCRRARLEWDARAAVEGLPAQLLPLRATEHRDGVAYL